MVEADAELPLPVRTSPILAQLVLRRLNLREGGIAQEKTRTPQRRTQESFASGTASVHAGLLIPLRIAPLAILTQQITLWYAVFAASTTEKQVYGLSRREMDPRRTSSTSRAGFEHLSRPTNTLPLQLLHFDWANGCAVPCFVDRERVCYKDTSEAHSPVIFLFLGRKKRIVSWIVPLQIPCQQVVL